MGQFDATKGKQALEIRSSLSERRALTDPILPGDSADLAHTLSRQWAKAHGEFIYSAFPFEFVIICCPCSGALIFTRSRSDSDADTLFIGIAYKHTVVRTFSSDSN